MVLKQSLLLSLFTLCLSHHMLGCLNFQTQTHLSERQGRLALVILSQREQVFDVLRLQVRRGRLKRFCGEECCV